MLRRVALVRTDDSEEQNAFFIRVTRIDEIGNDPSHLASVASSQILVTLMETLRSSETSGLTIATKRNIPEYAILCIK
jgi:hypothetical protein